MRALLLGVLVCVGCDRTTRISITAPTVMVTVTEERREPVPTAQPAIPAPTAGETEPGPTDLMGPPTDEDEGVPFNGPVVPVAPSVDAPDQECEKPGKGSGNGNGKGQGDTHACHPK